MHPMEMRPPAEKKEKKKKSTRQHSIDINAQHAARARHAPHACTRQRATQKTVNAPKLLFSQHTTFELHDPPPIPMISIGLHVRPTRMSRSWRMIPSKLRRNPASFALSTVWQHCTGPVEHEDCVGPGGFWVVLDGFGFGLGTALATARIARKK